MRDDERDMIDRHERQDGIVNRYTVGMGVTLFVAVAWIAYQVITYNFGG